MGFAGWLIAIGGLLVVMYATSHVVARLPASPALVYFVISLAASQGVRVLQRRTAIIR